MKQKAVVVPALVLAAMWGSGMQASAQTVPSPPTATDVTNAEVQKVLNLAHLDEQIRVVDLGKYNVAVGVLHRRAFRPRPDDPAGVPSYSHDQVTEVYYIMSGSGTLVTGGTFDNPVPEDLGVLVGPSLGGRTSGGRSRTVSEGDVVIIPAGVPHGFSAIEHHIDYLSFRVDADHVLPAGYVHEVIKGGSNQER